MDDNLLIARCQAGDSTPFRQLVLKHQDRLLTLCRYLLKNPHDAEDAAQESFIKAFRHIRDYSPDAPFYTWLSSIAVNTCRDIQRKNRIRSFFSLNVEQDQLDTYPDNQPDPEAVYASRQSLFALQSALNRLSLKLRTVLVLKELEGMSYEEIATVLGISIGTVKSRISRARDEIIRLMKKTTEQN